MLESCEKRAGGEGRRTVSVLPTYGESRDRDKPSRCGAEMLRPLGGCLLTADGSRSNSSRPKVVLAEWNGRRRASAGPWSFLRQRPALGGELHRPEPACSL